MTKSIAITANGTASQNGTSKWLSGPQPLATPNAATPTAARGKSNLSSTVFSTTRPRLLPQRKALDTVSARRGAANSHSATIAKTPTKKPSRMAGSWARTNGSRSMAVSRGSGAEMADRLFTFHTNDR